ncbi:MAG: hypothetical protein U0269_22440 [Polyangiales bacterium]
MTRLARFQWLIERLDPVASERTAPLYVKRPGTSAAELIATSVQLNPRQSHAVQSVIGAGKTSEMMRARQLCASAAPEVVTAWSDPTVASRPFDAMGAGWLVDWALHALSEELVRDAVGAADGRRSIEPLLLAPSEREALSIPFSREQQLRLVAAMLPRGATVFIDSVDRCEHHRALIEAIRSDVPTLSRVGIGVVIALPLRMRVAEEALLDALQPLQMHFIAAADTTREDDRRWLGEVLAVRDSDHLVSPAAANAIVGVSGGVVRFLVHIARTAAQIAFQTGAETVSVEHVDLAVRFFESAVLTQQLSSQDLSALRVFARQSTATALGERWWDHVAAGRILWDPKSKTPARLHPLLERMLQSEAA